MVIKTRYKRMMEGGREDEMGLEKFGGRRRIEEHMTWLKGRKKKWRR